MLGQALTTSVEVRDLHGHAGHPPRISFEWTDFPENNHFGQAIISLKLFNHDLLREITNLNEPSNI